MTKKIKIRYKSTYILTALSASHIDILREFDTLHKAKYKVETLLKEGAYEVSLIKRTWQTKHQYTDKEILFYDIDTELNPLVTNADNLEKLEQLEEYERSMLNNAGYLCDNLYYEKYGEGYGVADFEQEEED